MTNEQCCVVSCDRPLDDKYWNAQYNTNEIGWDLGEVSPPIKSYIDNLRNKNLKILIPGCGNTYEAEYLLQQGFTDITVIDIAETLVTSLNKKFKNNSYLKIILGDFFEHKNEYDLIIEQTFFCALPPTLRQRYVWKMHQLLKENGLLVGLLFNRTFEVGPPFGGSLNEYQNLFSNSFEFVQMIACLNSATPRANTELFIVLKKNSESFVNLYAFEGITCNGCLNTVTNKFLALENIKTVSMSSDFKDVLIVSISKIDINILQNEIAYDHLYTIKKIEH